MPITTAYICDRCQASKPDKDQMWCVVLAVWHVGHNPPNLHYNQSDARKGALWCRSCCEAVGVLGAWEPKAKPDVPAPIPPSLEDMIREIIQDEIAASHG